MLVGNPWGEQRARVICLVSQKGGVGKTTSAVNLGAALALSGHRVLLIGTDPQCGVSASLGFGRGDLRGGISTLFYSDLPLSEMAHPTVLENLSVLAPDVWTLDEEQRYAADMERRPEDFARIVDRARDSYDTVLIDCPPGLGPVSRAALLACDSFLVPVQAEELCRSSLERLIAGVEDLTADSALPPRIEGLFLTMVDNRTRMSRHVEQAVGEAYGADLMRTCVPRTTRLTEMALRGKPTVIHDRRSAGSRAYFDLADELIDRRRAGGAAAPCDAAEEPADAIPEAAVPSPAEPESAPEPAVCAPAAGPEKAAAPESPAAASHRVMSLLRDLGGPAPGFPGNGGSVHDPDPAAMSAGPSFEPEEPDMVSLDDLLDEEERSGGRRLDSDDSYWDSDEGYGSVN